MPGYIMHMVEAQIILSMLSKRHIGKQDNPDDWKELFAYGTLLPDAVEKKQKGVSHFWNNEERENVVIAPDLKEFLKKYGDKLSDPLLLGCFAHLHLDKLYFEEFLGNHVVFLNREGNIEKHLRDVDSVYIKKTGVQISLKQFFSEHYLYGDYTKLNHRLIERYDLKIPVYSDRIIKMCSDIFKEADCCNLELVFNKLGHFINEKDIKKCELKVFFYEDIVDFLEISAHRFMKEWYDNFS